MLEYLRRVEQARVIETCVLSYEAFQEAELVDLEEVLERYAPVTCERLLAQGAEDEEFRCVLWQHFGFLWHLLQMDRSFEELYSHAAGVVWDLDRVEQQSVGRLSQLGFSADCYRVMALLQKLRPIVTERQVLYQQLEARLQELHADPDGCPIHLMMTQVNVRYFRDELMLRFHDVAIQQPTPCTEIWTEEMCECERAYRKEQERVKELRQGQAFSRGYVTTGGDASAHAGRWYFPDDYGEDVIYMV